MVGIATLTPTYLTDPKLAATLAASPLTRHQLLAAPARSGPLFERRFALVRLALE
jgi:hypothetical protein